ncbi:hypothetical protein R7190_25110 [Vibrio sp. 1078-1]|uniref:hypothetical protein n=1 Tax=Vibrio sp. 1078-1 TaxID=3074544 RepID=UPI002964B7AE|nr:hypothetical protein [Vibrio sp. 1078-1]MDW2372085.1 hypothetical protein [Vibrio sp. 1078-1]
MLKLDIGDHLKKYSLILWLVLLAILIAPIAIYSFQFGIGVWSQHEDWASMGSALGGIYSPLIALLAFAVIFAQARVQLLSEQHSRDMVFIQDSKQDFNFYIERLDIVLNQKIDGEVTVNHFLINMLESVPDEDLLNIEVIDLCKRFDSQYKKVWGLWCGITPLLKGLESQKYFPYQHNFIGLKLRAVSMLSQQTCSCLDKLDYVLSKGRSSKPCFWEQST